MSNEYEENIPPKAATSTRDSDPPAKQSWALASAAGAALKRCWPRPALSAASAEGHHTPLWAGKGRMESCGSNRWCSVPGTNTTPCLEAGAHREGLLGWLVETVGGVNIQDTSLGFEGYHNRAQVQSPWKSLNCLLQCLASHGRKVANGVRSYSPMPERQTKTTTTKSPLRFTTILPAN